MGALLVQHAERILEQLTALDERWAGEVLCPSPNRVVLHTTWDGGPAPGMRVSDLIASPSERAFRLHESKVGRPAARRGQERLTRHEDAGSGWARRTAHQRERRISGNGAPELTAHQRERRNARQRERVANDPAWRERRNAQERQRLADNPERRERENAKSRERRRARRANDPAWRERQNAHARKRRERENTRKRARRANDPEWRERQNAQARKRWGSDPERRERENTRKRERRRRLRVQRREAGRGRACRQDAGDAAAHDPG